MPEDSFRPAACKSSMGGCRCFSRMLERTCNAVFVSCGAAASMTTVNPAFASEKPPLSPDQDTPLIVQSKVSAVLSFSVRALADQLNREVPRRIASFDDRETICGHRRGFFHRKVDIKCVVTGYIERTSPVYLRAQGNRIEAEVKLGGSVYGQGARGLARLIHGVAQGANGCLRCRQSSAKPQLELRSEYCAKLSLDGAANVAHFRARHSDCKICRAADPNAESSRRRRGCCKNAGHRRAGDSGGRLATRVHTSPKSPTAPGFG